MSWFNDLVQNVQSTTQTAWNSIVDQAQAAGQSISSAAQVATQAVGNAVDVVKYAPLLPFKNTMKNALKRKGIPYNDNIADISNKFFDYIIKKKSSYEESTYYLENFDTLEVVGACLNFIKNLLSMESKGETMTPEQKAILGDAKTDAAKVPEGSAGIPEGYNPATGEIVNKGNWMKWGAIAVIAAIVIYLIVKKK